MSEIDNQIEDYLHGVDEEDLCDICGEEILLCTCVEDKAKDIMVTERKNRKRRTKCEE